MDIMQDDAQGQLVVHWLEIQDRMSNNGVIKLQLEEAHQKHVVDEAETNRSTRFLGLSALYNTDGYKHEVDNDGTIFLTDEEDDTASL